MSADQTQPEAAGKDNLLGICHAIGEDFGFNPIFLRIPLAMGIIVSAKWTLIAYAALGLVVLASRLLVRKPKAPQVIVSPVSGVATAQSQAQPTEDLAIAA
jgi:phage shock protein PspC (stress-responsive transcriptional regulator)